MVRSRHWRNGITNAAMTELTRDDIRAAVGAGMISDAQAASLMVRAQVRRGERGRMAGLDESFELFRGFNELFIVAGLAVLFFGFAGFVESLRIRVADLPILSPIPAGYQNPICYGFFSLLYMTCAVALARHFTLRCRMVAPSIALSVIFFAGALAFGISVGSYVVERVNGDSIPIRLSFPMLMEWVHRAANEGVISLGLSIIGATATLLLAGFHVVFRVPISLALIAFSVLLTAYAVAFSVYAMPEFYQGFLLLSSEGPFAFLTLALGLIFLAFAMRYDLSDPHRATRRAAIAFWLHAVAALLIVHTVARWFYLQETFSGKLLLFPFVLVMALFAVVIDRRFFIIFGIGYLAAILIFFALAGDDGDVLLGFVLMLGLGLICLRLGAGWEALRSRLMRALPDFPGKRDLPPWDSGTAHDDSEIIRTCTSGSGIGSEDIRMAVDADTISDAQAASVMELARIRNDERRRTSGLEEPFEMFRGFNEIFIAAGLIMLAAGWIVLSVMVSIEVPGPGYSALAIAAFALIGMWVTVRLARYFTADRRMNAPSVALVVIFMIGAMALGVSFMIIGIAIVPTLLLAWYYFRFRVPFAMALNALWTYAVSIAIWSFLPFGGDWPESGRDLFLLSGEGSFGILTMILGLIYFAIALGFDMSDPHRVTLRAGAGFWMHAAAALMIVNTVAATLYVRESESAQMLLVLFVMLTAVLAIVIERRSYLIVGAGHIIALLFGLPENPNSVHAFASVSCLGLGFVVLGAQWQSARCWMMRVLPEFPGKYRLPPFGSATAAWAICATGQQIPSRTISTTNEGMRGRVDMAVSTSPTTETKGKKCRNEKRYCASCKEAVIVRFGALNWTLHIVLFVVLGLILGPFSLGITFIIWVIIFCMALVGRKKAQCPKCGMTL